MTNDAPRSSGERIKSEAHGDHWVAWIEDAVGKAEDAVVLVGATREEAEEKAKRWRDEQPRSSR